MNVAIGIHVRAEPENLLLTLESLRAHTAPPFSLLLLPDGLDAEAGAVLAGLSGLRQLATPDTQGAPACFNRLMRNATAEVAIFLESGVLVGPGWLDRILHAFESDQSIGLAGPSTNLAWNEQASFPAAGAGTDDIADTAQEAFRRFGTAYKTLEPLYSLSDFCYAVRRDVFHSIGPADELYGLGPCWEMDYNIRAARAGFRGVWVCASYVHRASVPEQRLRDEALHFEASRQRYQDKFCGRRLSGRKEGYRPHCRGDACPNFAPDSLVRIGTACNRTATIPPPVLQDQPLVSCIMPTHNRRRFVPGAIEYFKRQDYPNLELIIVDSGSDSIGDLVPDDPRMRYFRLSQRLPTGMMRNRACQLAKGEIIVHWDDDDWYPPHRVRAQVLPIIQGQAEITGAAGIYFYELSSGRAFLYQYQGNQKPFVVGSTLAYRRSYWQRHPFSGTQVGEDCHFVWTASVSAVLDLNDPGLCIASIHQENTSPRDTAGQGWSAVPVENLLAIMKLDSHIDDWPLVSCIMPTFNRRPLIPLALQSFQAQTYPRKELIVVDDGSDPVGDLLQGVREVRYIRIQQRLTIGAKRNLACRHVNGEIIAHWDDDDWYAPRRLEHQTAPLLAHLADLTGLANRFVLEMPCGRFWTTLDHLHRRMFVGDVHGGTLVYRKAILREHIAYPEADLAEDAGLIAQALRCNKRLMRLENPGLFVYLRHQTNAWRFEVGRFLDPAGWQLTTPPPGFSPQLLDLYRQATTPV